MISCLQNRIQLFEFIEIKVARSVIIQEVVDRFADFVGIIPVQSLILRGVKLTERRNNIAGRRFVYVRTIFDFRKRFLYTVKAIKGKRIIFLFQLTSGFQHLFLRYNGTQTV